MLYPYKSQKQTQRKQDQNLLSKLNKAINEHLDDSEFTIKKLSEEVGLSHMHLYRKIKMSKNQSPSQYLRSQRLEQSAKLLYEHHDNISQIAYMVGFNSVSYFNKCFKEYFHCTPSQYQLFSKQPGKIPEHR